MPGGATPALPCLSRLGGAVLRFSGRRAETFKGPWPAGLGGVSHLRSTDCWTTVPMEPSFIRLPSDAWNASLQVAEQAGRADFRRLACGCQRSRRKRRRMRTTTVRGNYMSMLIGRILHMGLESPGRMISDSAHSPTPTHPSPPPPTSPAWHGPARSSLARPDRELGRIGVCSREQWCFRAYCCPSRGEPPSPIP